jgi:hypothetical protein
MKIIYMEPKLIEQRDRKEQNERMVNSLLYMSNINPEGNELTYILGEGTEGSNRLALTYWVSSMSQELGLPYAKRDCELLHDMLMVSLEVF